MLTRQTFWLLFLSLSLLFVLYIAISAKATNSIVNEMSGGTSGGREVNPVDDWPPHLSFIKAKNRLAADPSTKIYILRDGFDLEYIWRIQYTEQLLNSLKTEWSLAEIQSTPTWPILELTSESLNQTVPSWWKFNLDNAGDFSFFNGPKSSATGEGSHVQIVVDKQKSFVFGHYLSEL